MQDALRILIAGGDALERGAVRQAVLQHHAGAAVQEAGSCSGATEAVQSQAFDCILLGDDLPDAGGLGCLREIRGAGVTTPVILLTGDEGQEAVRAGATDYLPKGDLTPRLLDRCLRSVLRFHQSQEQIRRAQEELRLRDRAIAASSNGIVIADARHADCPIIYVNPAFTSMTGYPPEEAIGRNCRFLQGADTDGRYVQQVRDGLREGRDFRVVLKNYRKDGTPFWNALALSPVRDAAGTITHFIGVQTDITEQREAEEALRQNVARQHALLRDMFASVTEGRLTLCASGADLPPPLTPFAGPIPLSKTGGIRELRRQTLGASVAAGLPDERRYDLETAAGEAAMNAVVHAGTGVGHVFTHGGGTVQVRVEDAGAGIAVENLPNATLRRGYTTAGTMGHGFKMILKTVDRVHLLTGGAGTTVVMEQDRAAPAPNW